MEFLSIFVVASVPIVKVLLLGAFGALLATPYLNILPQDARYHLNKLVFSVYTPALVFCNLAQSVSPAKIIDWWFLPVNVIMTFFIGTLLGLIVVKVLKPQPSLERITVACCSSGNVGNLPLLLVPAVCLDSKGLFKQSEVCIQNSLAYVSFGLAITTLILWTYTFHLLKPAQFKERDDLTSANPTIRNVVDSGSKEAQNEELVVMKSFTEEEQFETLELQEFVPQAQAWSDIFRNKMKDWASKFPLGILLNPPNAAVVAAFIVGGIPLFKRSLVGSDAPLRLIQDCLSTLGTAALPSMILLLGGNLTQGSSSGSEKMNASVLASITVVKLVLVPALGLCFVLGASHLGLVPEDPLFRLVLLVQYAMPSAFTIGVIAQLYNMGEQVTIVLFWSYICSVLTTTVWTTLYLWILF
ncbi:hypothetical protein KP509_10G038100 [Ceratopteris richardii]|uniref:Uncharacterized protein n=1 Tax=Ceratopteris richardii TaxID=49495 RepID=A0A8T2U065_CERRI|nr:hypothetical protein KP509_10G038100 [Ceratopteris richardii]